MEFFAQISEALKPQYTAGLCKYKSRGPYECRRLKVSDNDKLVLFCDRLFWVFVR